MLRTIFERHILPKLQTFQAEVDSATVTVATGNKQGTYSSLGGGLLTYNPSEPFHRDPIVVASITDSGDDAGYVKLLGSPVKNAISMQGVDGLGSGLDTDIHSLVLGWMSTTEDLVVKQALKGRYDRPRYLTCKVTGSANATIDIGKPDFRSSGVTVNGTGDYSLEFIRTFSKVPTVIASLIGSAGAIKVTSTTTGIRIRTYDASGTPTHKSFYAHIYGTDSFAESGVLHRAVKSTHCKPEIIGLSITVDAGTPTLSIGDDLATVTDNGVGDYTIDLTEVYARELIPVGMSNVRVHFGTVDSDSIQILTTDSSGAPVDASTVHVLAIGYKDANEYYQFKG